MKGPNPRRWTVAGRPYEEVAPLPDDVDLVDHLLSLRLPEDGAERAAFLSPDLSHVPDPLRIDGMEAAVSTVERALRARERILVHGDYDADGVTATALLVSFLRGIGADCVYHVPDRLGEGSGLSERSTEVVRETGARLVVTVDCGVSALEEIAAMKAAGVAVVVTDHHVCKAELPAADAVVDPKRPDATFPFDGLSGAGLALRLTQALCARLSLGDRWLDGVDLAAIGTVADVVPVLHENRFWVALGLARMRRSPRPGVRALLDASSTAPDALDEASVAFRLAPRLNAAGRMGDATRAVELLLSSDPARAAALAAELERENARRQAVEGRIFDEASAKARELLAAGLAAPAAPLVVASAGWHPGVVGIVASRLVEAFGRSAIVFADENGQLRGSGRGCGDFDLLSAIASAAPLTVRFGGHRKAAGVVIEPDRLDAFRAALTAHAAALPAPGSGDAGPAVEADAVLPPAALTLDRALSLQRLAPFGEGNPRPLFVARGLRVAAQRPLSEGKHRRFAFTTADGRSVPDGIAFGSASRPDSFADGDSIDVLFQLDVNEFRGTKSVQLQIRDLRAGAPRTVRTSLFGAAYRYLKDPRRADGCVYDPTGMSRDLGPVDGGATATGFELETVFAILEESSLAVFEPTAAGRRKVRLLPTADRVRLDDSPTYRRLKEEGALQADA